YPGGTATEKLLRHRLDPLEPVEKLKPDVPRGVGAVVQKMLAKKPEDRYQTPGDVVAALSMPLDQVGVDLLTQVGADGRIMTVQRRSGLVGGAASAAPVAVLVPGNSPAASAIPVTLNDDDTLASGRKLALPAKPLWRQSRWQIGAGAALAVLVLLVLLVRP